MKASLSSAARGSIGTNTAPVIEAPTMASTKAGWLRIMMAKLAPSTQSLDARAAAMRLPWRHRSP